MDQDLHEASDLLRKLDTERRRVDMCTARLVASMSSSATGNRPLVTTMYLLETAIAQAMAEGIDVSVAQLHVEGLREKKRRAEIVVRQLRQLLHATSTSTSITTTASTTTTAAIPPSSTMSIIDTLTSTPPPTSTSTMITSYDYAFDPKDLIEEMEVAIEAVRREGGELTDENDITQGLTRLHSWREEQAQMEEWISSLEIACQCVTYEDTKELERVLEMVRLKERISVAAAVRRWEQVQMQGRVAVCLQEAVLGIAPVQRSDTAENNNNNHYHHHHNNNNNNHHHHHNNSSNIRYHTNMKVMQRLITFAQSVDVPTGRSSSSPYLHSPPITRFLGLCTVPHLLH